MAKITRSDIIGPTGLGFIQELYSVIAPNEVAFNTLVDSVIAVEAAKLTNRITAAVYDLATNLTYVKEAEKCLVAADMIQRHINIVISNIKASGNEIDTAPEERQMKRYLDKAEEWIGKLAQGITVDASRDIGVTVITSTRFSS